MSKSSKSAPKVRPDDRCVFHHLKDADQKAVLRQHADHWAERGGMPRGMRDRESITVCRNLTHAQAVEYLSLINSRILSHRGMMSALVVPFVVGWAVDGDGEALGFPVEVWMTQAADDRSAAAGLYDIVDRSVPLYRLPWMFGLGWVWDDR